MANTCTSHTYTSTLHSRFPHACTQQVSVERCTDADMGSLRTCSGDQTLEWALRMEEDAVKEQDRVPHEVYRLWGLKEAKLKSTMLWEDWTSKWSNMPEANYPTIASTPPHKQMLEKLDCKPHFTTYFLAVKYIYISICTGEQQKTMQVITHAFYLTKTEETCSNTSDQMTSKVA